MIINLVIGIIFILVGFGIGLWNRFDSSRESDFGCGMFWSGGIHLMISAIIYGA